MKNPNDHPSASVPLIALCDQGMPLDGTATTARHAAKALGYRPPADILSGHLAGGTCHG